MERLKLSFLGSPHIERKGERLAIKSSKALALLAYLAWLDVVNQTIARLEQPAAVSTKGFSSC